MYNQIVSAAKTIDLIHSIANPNYDGTPDVEHKSIITGKRNFILEPDHRTYSITEFLCKYPDSGVQQLSDLESMKNTFVYYRPKNEILQDRSGTEVLFYLESIKPFYLDVADRYGACIIILKSTDGISKVVVVASYGHNYGHNYGSGF